MKHWIPTPAILATLFASLVVSAPIMYATDLRGGVVGHSGPLVGVGIALFEVKPNKTLHLVRQTVTAPDGNYYFNKVHPGQYVLRIRGINYPLEVRETEMQDIPVIIAPRHWTKTVHALRIASRTSSLLRAKPPTTSHARQQAEWWCT
jgi:hypothetical protein